MPMTAYIGNANPPSGATSGKPVKITLQGFPDPGTATDGQLLIGDTGVGMVLNELTPGPGITITNGPGSITIEATGGEAMVLNYNDPAWTVNGINDTFAMPDYAPNQIQMYIGTIRVPPNAINASSGTEFVVTNPAYIPQVGDYVYVDYQPA